MAGFTLFHAVALIVLFFKGAISLGRKDLSWKSPYYVNLAFLYILGLNLMNLSHVKVSSFIYTLVIIIEIILLYNIVYVMDTQKVKKVMKGIIGLYFFNILIATAIIMLHIYPNKYVLKIIQIYYFDGRIRPYGFSDEPSYAAIILVFSLFLFLKCNDFKYQKSDFKWYLMGLLAIFLTGSSYGYLMLLILMLYFFSRNRFLFSTIETIQRSKLFSKLELVVLVALCLGIVTIGISRVDFSNNKSINRLINITTTISQSNESVFEAVKRIAYTDGSASMRIMPTLLMIKEYKYDSWGGILFGHGAGQSTHFFTRLYNDDKTLLGFIPSFIYNYGLIGAGLFLLFFISLFPRKKIVLFLLFFLFLFNADFNTQIFLFVLFTIMASKQIETQKPSTLTYE